MDPPAYWALNVRMVVVGTRESRLGPVACGGAGSEGRRPSSFDSCNRRARDRLSVPRRSGPVERAARRQCRPSSLSRRLVKLDRELRFAPAGARGRRAFDAWGE